MSCYNQLCIRIDKPINNERFLSMTFDLREAAVVHGFAGYFDAILYDDISISKLSYVPRLLAATTNNFILQRNPS